MSIFSIPYSLHKHNNNLKLQKHTYGKLCFGIKVRIAILKHYGTYFESSTLRGEVILRSAIHMERLVYNLQK